MGLEVAGMICEREDDRNRMPLWIYFIPAPLKKRLEDLLYSHITQNKVRRPNRKKRGRHESNIRKK